MSTRDLWLPLQTGVEVAVASSSPDKLLGVREGFLRFLRDGMHSRAPVLVTSGRRDSRLEPLPYSDREALEMARSKVRELRDSLGVRYDCLVASEGGLCSAELDGEERYFVRTWTIVVGFGGEAWGASGSIQMPRGLLDATGGDLPRAVPGTRRGGGMMGSLTRGLESRRSAVAESTCHALASLVFESLGAERG